MQANVAPVALRPVQAEDESFLLRLYSASRAAELSLSWDEAARAAFLQLQYAAQRAGYQRMFPDANWQIILAGGQKIGRIITLSAPGEIRLVDVRLLPEWTGKGIGTQLITELQNQAARENKPVRLHSAKGSSATRLYQRLGFVKSAETAVHEQLEWRPGGQRPVPPARIE